MPHKLISRLWFITILLCSSGLLADDSLPARDRLISCDPHIALAAAKEILNDPEILNEPLEMFLPAFILFQNGEKDQAVFWFYAAQLRVRYQLAFQQGDRGQLLQIMLMTTGPPINNYAFHDVKKLDRLIGQVLEWDKTAPNPFRDKPHSSDVVSQIEKVYSGFHDLRSKLLVDKDDVEQKARDAAPQIAQMMEQSRPRPCQAGKPDPAYANKIIEMEKKSVTEFVKTQKEVLREVETIKNVNIASYKKLSDSVLPVRYTVSVRGTSKHIYAEVDVLRVDDDVTFKLACVTPISLGQRNPFKDVCAQ